ncbi:hypothetical protein LWI28_011207 [Acer negundo]|uniref:Reverse transcriptase domain-containing protein n=1 Tax=Acer negundo TaxID=4023 RepID=A0AAD5NX41_ACENE|nr:hypothetical protein LWI28_011207 [Acer negundo]
MLERPFSKDEELEAVNDCDGNNAPGPDEMNLNFIKANWGEIEEDFMRFTLEFYIDGDLVKDLNNSFIALIPKYANPEAITHYRPISLVGLLYKVISKILANRLKRVMNSIIGENQMAFVANR